jgi:signal transduction histidine kinase
MSRETRHIGRLSLITTGVALLALFVLMAGERWYSAVNEAAENSAEQADILSANAGAALAFDDADAGGELLASLRKSTYVRQAVLYRNDGSILASVLKPGEQDHLAEPPTDLGKASQQLTLTGWRVVVPIHVNAQSVGAIVIWSSLGHVSYELQEFAAVFVLIAGLALFLSYYSSQGMRRRMLDSQEQLRNSQALIRQLSVHRDTLVEEEHKRIALEIHDDLGQLLTTAMLSLKSIARRLRNQKSVNAEQIDEVESLVRDAFRSIKVIGARLRPPVLDIGLAAALEWLAENMLAQAGIRLALDMSDKLPPLNDRCAITLFRIAQESLSNVVHHSKAEYVHISLQFDAEFLMLSIEDDGIGFDGGPQDGKPHFGLLGIRERIASLQGIVDIESVVGSGTCITVRVPIAAAIMESEGT